MPSNHLSLCRPLLLPPSVFPSIRVISSESALRIRWPKYWSFSFNISPSSEYSELISFREMVIHAVKSLLALLKGGHSVLPRPGTSYAGSLRKSRGGRCSECVLFAGCVPSQPSLSSRVCPASHRLPEVLGSRVRLPEGLCPYRLLSTGASSPVTRVVFHSCPQVFSSLQSASVSPDLDSPTLCVHISWDGVTWPAAQA